MKPIFKEITIWGRVIKFSHTIFALPFALSMVVIVSRSQPITIEQIAWIIVAVVAARTAAMSYNRLHDRDIDSENTRTQTRELPSGQVSSTSVRILLVLASFIFFYSAYALGWHCFLLAPAVLGFLLFYSTTKRFTHSSHFVLGFALAMAPGGVWYALTGRLSYVPLVLMIGVMFWVSGFDILYSCQDKAFDEKHCLHSIPVTFGIERAFLLAQSFHVLSIIALVFFGILEDCGMVYYVGVGIFALVIASQYRLVKPDDLRLLNAAFFSRNGAASVIYFAGVLVDRVMGN